MNELIINNKDELVMKLLHYFITEEGYNPIIIHGSHNEIWLENMEAPYKIIRIMTGHIHNNEQFEFDLYKTQMIINRIKRKTFSFKMNALSIFLDLGDNVIIESPHDINCINVNNEQDILKYDIIRNAFPTIANKLKFVETGIQLFTKITKDLNQKSKEETIKTENVFNIKPPYVTYILMSISIFVFLFTYLLYFLGFDSLALLDLGVLHGPSVKLGQYYRLITPVFIHIGIIHLFFNMYALFIIGTQLESFYGRFKYLIIYFYSAITGSLLSMTFSPDGVSAGASGAIFGLLGALLYFGYHYRVYLGNVMKTQIIPIIILNLLIGFTLPNIDQAAHIGGLVGGFIISTAVGVKYKSTKFDQINGIIGSILLLLFLIYLAFIYVG